MLATHIHYRRSLKFLTKNKHENKILHIAPTTANYTKTYYLSTYIQADWMGAASFCQNVGMTLATLDSLPEVTFFLGLCEANRKYFQYKVSDLFFIGGASPNIVDRSVYRSELSCDRGYLSFKHRGLQIIFSNPQANLGLVFNRTEE